jgi:outer membrane cobalamin receptor
MNYSLLIVVLSLSASVAHSQDANPASNADVNSVMEEVMVTAMRREQNPQDINKQ